MPQTTAACAPPPFKDWLAAFRTEALANGIQPAVFDQALSGLTPDPAVIQRDRGQQVFAQDFLTFANKKVNERLARGKAQLSKYPELFRRITQTYGVPAEVLVALWGLESDFGANTGDFPTLRSLLTLAHDCRRPELFRQELLAALRLIQQGDLTPANMRGAWVGEIGQLQFLVSRYDQYAVDFDGDGKRDLIRSSADALASAANKLQQAGWQAGEPWLEEVQVPLEMDWKIARPDYLLSLKEWATQGVTYPDGSPLQGGGEAALLLPLGRNGPAFLAYPNFKVFLAWNESSVYALTAAYFATRLAGAPPLRAGNATVKPLSPTQTKQLQAKLQARGYAISKVDGIIGEETRAAVRQAQQELGLPADGYPDSALLERL